ncbi:MAG TPA: 2-C-methyl-D-erythritol 2,4-cyclodiphosphate synthase [Desulfatiglandales bacterium]|nr:2-C-methyl-D-erythritol 2,4-cyclodiphosphate synthase [Desulfatiglandales bacterium]
MFRVGCGYDVHILTQGKPLILGGVRVAYDKGLLGYSDADVLTHAIIDAILGALGKGDIGRHFPDTDPSYKGIDSFFLLEEVAKMVRKDGFILNNLDATIVAERPKLIDYINSMEEKLSGTLGVDSKMINIKATTTEGLGFCGREEGIAAYAVVTLKSA